jgi:flagellar protein FliO/FliZ
MFLTLIALTTLMALTVWFIRRLIRSRLEKGVGEQKIEIIEKRLLSPKTMLYLVEVDGEQVLLAESQLEVRPLKTRQSPQGAQE